MADVFIDLVKRMVIFLIAGQTILHFGMGKQYERYVKLTISLMLVAQLVSAFTGFFPFFPKNSLNMAGEEGRASFEKRWEENIEEFGEKLDLQQKEMEKEWEEEVRKMNHEEERKEESQINIEEIKIR